MGAILKRHAIGASSTLLFLLILISCAALPDVQTSLDRSVDFQRFRTFAWYQPSPAANTQPGHTAFSPNLDNRVRLAIESELVKRGLRPATEAPDLLVAYDINIGQPAQEIPADVFAPGFSYGYSYLFGYRYNYSTTRLPNYRTIAAYPEGTLLIDLIDPATNELIWRGWINGAITADMAEDEREINGAVASIISRLPGSAIGR